MKTVMCEKEEKPRPPADGRAPEPPALRPQNLRITRDATGRLAVTHGDEHWDGVSAVRAFPLTDPDRWVTLADEGGMEIGFLERTVELDDSSRRVLEEELARVYFTARVKAIRAIKSRYGVTSWDLDTDLGERRAHVKDRSDIRSLPDGRIVIMDVDGVHYLIEERSRLDARSRRLLDQEL